MKIIPVFILRGLKTVRHSFCGGRIGNGRLSIPPEGRRQGTSGFSPRGSIPHAGCPYKCVYCDQHKISGAVSMPSVEEVHSVIRRNLKTIPKNEDVEIAFFGGTFTFLPESLQARYLDAVYHFGRKLRMSTHPEAVSLKAMSRFKRKGGWLVELGVQSLDREVLRNIKRETSFESVKNAAACIKKAGLELGVQVMLGLPGDTLEKSIGTAKKLVKLKPETARIYPTLVLKGTELAERYRKGKYKPLSMEESIEQAAAITDIFERSGVKVIRIGLHPSKDLGSRNIVLAGPYHPAFGEMVRSRQMRNKIIAAINDKDIMNRSHIEIHVPYNMLNLISGHRGTEKQFLEKHFNVPLNLFHLRGGTRVTVRDVRKDIAIVDPRMPEQAKEKLKRLDYHVTEIPLHRKLQKSISGHADMLLFRLRNKVIYEPCLEDIAVLLRKNGYECIKGEKIESGVYPNDIIYDACAIGEYLIHYKGNIDRNIQKIRLKHIPVNQGYARCSIVPVDERRIITSDAGIKEAWRKNGCTALLVRQGYVKLPGYNTGFIGGTAGVTDRYVVFVGSLDTHPDSREIRGFIKKAGKGIIELCDGPLYDVGTIYFFESRGSTPAFLTC